MSDPIPRLNAALEGRYEIEREIGEGGMATVYLADDLKHERKVALKVLKPELAAVVGAERFLAEIKTTANLQHPHILPLYDSGEADSLLFYVMPYVDGESLRERLDREHQLPVDDAVRIATNMAEALDYAHRQGVIHRDIKPANVLLQDGKPVISDFGIALAVSAGGGSRLTETGLSLGTPHYMSPEQATGDQNVGPATDIYALGCVLYEMLVGEPPFTGSTPQAVLGKIIAADTPSARAQRSSVPKNVDAAVRRSLERVPADRFAVAGALTGALDDGAFRWGEGAKVRRPASWMLGTATAVVATAIVTVLVTRTALPPTTLEDQRPESALSFFLPEDQLLSPGNPAAMALSPDGTRLVYVGERAGVRQLYVRELERFGVRPLDGTEGARAPFFSPDGRSVGFHANGALHRVALDGGIPARLTEVTEAPVGASWGEDGTIVFALDGASVWRTTESGSRAVEIPLVLDTAYLRDHPDLPTPRSIADTRWPDHLPGEERALVVTSYSPSTMGVIDLATGSFRPIGRGDRPTYLPTGTIVFYSGPETVSHVAFDAQALKITGPAIPLIDNALRPAGSEGRFVVSESGTVAYARGGFDRQLVFVDRNGREEPLDVEPRGYRFPRVSPDGRSLAVTVDPQPPQIWVIDLGRLTSQPVTTSGYNLVPVWSPNGDRLAFGTQPGIAWVPWPGGGEPNQVRAAPGGVLDWPRSDRIFAAVPPGADIVLVDVENRTESAWLATPANERYPRLLPGSEWVVYTSDVTGTSEVYVRSYGGNEGPERVSTEGGTEPRWSADGTEIFYRSGDAIMAVSVRPTATFDVTGTPVRLFAETYDFTNDQNWDVLPDGRFVMIRSNPNIGREIRFLANWLDEDGSPR
ncbi:MAG: protein kinase [Gemmatimonadota bacterium]|nr:protein kinase [Gemmatimonadota bacterium]